jgi:hypothetical protein
MFHYNARLGVSVRIEPLWEAMTDSWVERTRGAFPPAESVKYHFGGEAVDVLKPNGDLLFALRPRTIDRTLLKAAYADLRRAARATTHRPEAANGQEPFRSNVVGYLKGKLTFATRSNLRGYRRIQKVLGNMADVFRDHCPEQYYFLQEAAARTPNVIIPGTEVMTSATVNLWTRDRPTRMGIHRDAKNLPGAYGVMTVIRIGAFFGGYLVWPKYRCAVKLSNGDCLICDNRQAHGNTDVEGKGDWTRLSVVGYYNASNR